MSRPRVASEGVQVLGYHLVGAAANDVRINTPAADFRCQMEQLAERGTAVSLDDALDLLRGERAAPIAGRPAVVLTFDDAYRNFVTAAWPVLRDLALPATLYVPTAFVDGEGGEPISGTGLPAASWDELARLRDEGVTLGSHSHAHRDLPGLRDDEVEADLERARQLLDRRLGIEAEHFCYPRALSSPPDASIVALHHASAVLAGGRTNRPGTSPLRLRRFPVMRSLGPDLAPLLDRRLQPREWAASLKRRLVVLRLRLCKPWRR